MKVGPGSANPPKKQTDAQTPSSENSEFSGRNTEVSSEKKNTHSNPSPRRPAAEKLQNRQVKSVDGKGSLEGRLTQEKIMLALMRDDVNSLKQLLEENKSRQTTSAQQITHTLLHKALSRKAEKCVRMLIEATPESMEFKDAHGRTAFHYAVMANDKQSLQVMLNYETKKKPLSEKDIFQQTPLHIAAMGGYSDLVKLILDANPQSINLKDYQGNIPLHLAAESGNKEAVAVLIKTDLACLGMANNDGFTPVHKAAQHPASDNLRLMLSYREGADQLLRKESHGNTPLHLAAEKGHKDCVAILVQQEPGSSGVENNDKQTPLHLASKCYKNGSLQLILDSNKETELLLWQDKAGNTALHLAAEKGMDQCAEVLIQKEPDSLSIKNYKGQTPVHLAAAHIKSNTLQSMLNSEQGAEQLLVQDANGSTPFHMAAGANLDSVKRVVKVNPDGLLVRDNDGKTPMDQAVERSNREILKWCLRQPGILDRLKESRVIPFTVFDYKGYVHWYKRKKASAESRKNKSVISAENFNKEKYHAEKRRSKWLLLSKKSMKKRSGPEPFESKRHSTVAGLDLEHEGVLTGRQSHLNEARAILAGLGSVGVYVHCLDLDIDVKKKGALSMGDESACVNTIKSLASMGAQNICVQLSPPNFSTPGERKALLSDPDKKKEFDESQRKAFHKLAFLLPEFKTEKATPQHINIHGCKVSIYGCDDDIPETVVTFSFDDVRKKISQVGYHNNDLVVVRPYRFGEKSNALFEKKVDGSFYTETLELPTNAILHDVNIETESNNEAVPDSRYSDEVINAVHHLCQISKESKAHIGVVYGLHHTAIPDEKKEAVLTNWIGAVRTQINQKKISKRVVIGLFRANKFQEGMIDEVAKDTGTHVVDISNEDGRDALNNLKNGEIYLFLIPDLPHDVFNKLVVQSDLPTLTEGANLTSFLLESEHAHLSVLPSGNTPVAQDMGNPLEALKAKAFSYKLAINKKKNDGGLQSNEKKVLDELVKRIKDEDYSGAMDYFNNLRSGMFKNLNFLWSKDTGGQLTNTVTIESLLEKGEKMGDIEKKALIAALDPSDEALGEYLNSCLDKESHTADHFKLMSMHVNQGFNDVIAMTLIKYCQHKNFLQNQDA